MITQNSVGVLTVKTRLDYTTRNHYVLNIQCNDPGMKVAHTTVTVLVKDVNSPPYFDDSTPYSLSVTENEPVGNVVIAMVGLDKDVGENARLKYSLASTSKQFGINPNSGAITIVMPLDREKLAKYELSVTVRDHGSPPLSRTGKLHVIIEDVNDNPPVFGQSDYTVKVPEDIRPDTNVITVSGKSNAFEFAQILYLCTKRLVASV